MSIFDELLRDVKIPKIYEVNNIIKDNSIDKPGQYLTDNLVDSCALKKIKRNDKVAIAVGSREIANLNIIVRTLANEIKKRGAYPFIVPAMGSHGGATGIGQEQVLEQLHITEQQVGAPIISSMQTEYLGKTTSGLGVYIDTNAFHADHIIPVARIKPHTDFRGVYESGIIKMIAVGLGKQKGANECHSRGMGKIEDSILEVGRCIIQKCNVLFAIALIENALHKTSGINIVPVDKILECEPALLIQAKSIMPKIPYEEVDVVIISQMGKNISGVGMDTNVIGRSAILGVSRPMAKRIAVLDLTDESHNNANGIGLADITTRRLFSKINFDITYPNAITSNVLDLVKIPVVLENDYQVVKCAIKTSCINDKRAIRLMIIRDTLTLDRFFVSEALIDVKTSADLTYGNQITLEFNSKGNLK